MLQTYRVLTFKNKYSKNNSSKLKRQKCNSNGTCNLSYYAFILIILSQGFNIFIHLWISFNVYNGFIVEIFHFADNWNGNGNDILLNNLELLHQFDYNFLDLTKKRKENSWFQIRRWKKIVSFNLIYTHNIFFPSSTQTKTETLNFMLWYFLSKHRNFEFQVKMHTSSKNYAHIHTHAPITT